MSMEQQVSKIREALSPHKGHEISVNGYITTIPDPNDLTDESVARGYLGSSVRCLCCKHHLSKQWV